MLFDNLTGTPAMRDSNVGARVPARATVATKYRDDALATYPPRLSTSKRGGYPQTPYLLSYTYEEKIPFTKGYPLRKSFRSDMLRGYLQNSSFVFIDLARKRVFWSIYPIVLGKHCGLRCLFIGKQAAEAIAVGCSTERRCKLGIVISPTLERKGGAAFVGWAEPKMSGGWDYSGA